jgi:hypothetical protein
VAASPTAWGPKGKKIPKVTANDRTKIIHGLLSRFFSNPVGKKFIYFKICSIIMGRNSGLS